MVFCVGFFGSVGDGGRIEGLSSLCGWLPIQLGAGNVIARRSGVVNLVSIALVMLGASVVLLGVVLALVKLHRRRERLFAEQRRLKYIDTLGRMVFEQDGIPRMLRRRSNDPVFREVLLHHLRYLEGQERDYLVGVAQELGLVDRYGRELHHRRPVMRVNAAEALTELADPATVRMLVMALLDSVPEVRIQAAAGLSRIRDPQATRPILTRLDRENEWAAHRIADALCRFGSVAVEAMIEYLEGSDIYAPLVVRALGIIGDTRAEPVLVRMVDSDSEEVRLRAVAALGKAGSPRSMLTLAQALRDPSWEVRAQAARAMGELMDGQAVIWLRRALTDQSWWVRNNAAASLAELPGGSHALQDALDDFDPYARDIAAAMLLSSGHARRAIDHLEADDPIQREEARTLIKKLIAVGKEEYFRQAGSLETMGDPKVALN